MGTRSRIAIANSDGSFTSIYCHWDGYPTGVGATLAEHYADESTIRRLMALGNLSVLRNTVGEKHSFNNQETPRRMEWTTAYGRDRGETEQEATVSPSLAALNELTQSSGGEYLYIYKDGQWYVAEGGVSAFGMPASKAPGEARLLSEVLADEEKNED